MTFLSIVLTGRNDTHGGDFRTRFFRTLKFNHAQLNARNIPHEYVFVEWAPEASRPPLADVVFEEMPELFRDAFTFYMVDPRYQGALSLDPRLQYLEFIAKNVGIRRATGQFVLTTNCDIYLGQHVLSRLEHRDLLTGTIYRASRHDLKRDLDTSHVDWALLEDPAYLSGAPPPPLNPPLMAGATGDFILLDRETFHAMRGFNELFRLGRLGIDRNFLTKAYSDGRPIADIGGPVYHASHGESYRGDRHVTRSADEDASRGYKEWYARGVSYQNREDWGLARAPVRTLKPGQWQLDFSWDAVPPMVDLKAIRMPVDRPDQAQPRRYVARN